MPHFLFADVGVGRVKTGEEKEIRRRDGMFWLIVFVPLSHDQSLLRPAAEAGGHKHEINSIIICNHSSFNVLVACPLYFLVTVDNLPR